MRYNYEALSPESFQKFAQALIVAKHPDTQCLPVGQPDGGRDAFFYHMEMEKERFVVFQVKFSREPGAKDERDVVSSVLDTEYDKVQKLISRGASHYYLITNVAGTSHLETGSIDKAHQDLTAKLGIPSQIWWRDDLDRRLDNATDIKWSYPEICSAADVLAFLIKSRESEEEPQYSRAITSYVAKQYTTDRDVKFKQVELTRRLTDLFVDLPIAKRRNGPQEGKTRRIRRQGNLLGQVMKYVDILDYDDHFEYDEEHPFHQRAAAANFFLNMPLGERVSRFVLEGAPGQGKSTVTQYLCQVNRLKLLRKPELRGMPAAHTEAPVRVPFRVDLRDFASWLSGRHPFSKANETILPAEGKRSLESFLAMQVAWNSGGLEIGERELLQFLARSHCLLVLDGFDEVADIETRRKVVEEIREAAERFDAHVQSLQIIVTSRPAAFANSPGFPDDEWVHLELRDLRKPHIDAYKDKWVIARDLSDSEAEVVSTTLEAKLEQPHIRDLARNPMQLAILLQLIHVQGAALPDKRTTLYEKYMELFFNREAEKSTVVRDHRDLITSIHGYLGWVLQTQAEDGRGAGSVEKAELRRLIRDYLESEEYDTGLVDTLLHGMVERVVALVSRVEGTYEFEVQPIREYFTAKFLYETSPYSPAGREKSGSRPDRLEALAKSFYWTNVTRFFCGFYDKGELPSLIDGLIQLSESDSYSLISQPRRLAVMLLSDWVFAQSPRAVKQLTEYLTTDPGFFRLAAEEEELTRQIMTLPERSGQKELVDACFEKLGMTDDPDAIRVLRRIIAHNTDTRWLKEEWRGRCDFARPDSAVVDELSEFNLINRYTVPEIKSICGERRSLYREWLCRGGRTEEILRDVSLAEEVFELLLAGEVNIPFRHPGSSGSGLEVINALCRPHLFAELARAPKEVQALEVFVERTPFAFEFTREIDNTGPRTAPAERIHSFANFLLSILQKSAKDWQTKTSPWSELVDRGYEEAPGSHLFTKMALLGATVKGKASGTWSDKGWEPSSGLVERLRYVRLKNADDGWWHREISSAAFLTDPTLVLTCCFLWANLKIILTLKPQLEALVNGLTKEQWERLSSTCSLLAVGSGISAAPAKASDLQALDGGASTRFASLVISRGHNQESGRAAARRMFRGRLEDDARLIQQATLLEFSSEKDIDWSYVAEISLVTKRASINWLSPLRRQQIQIPDHVAIEVLTRCNDHAVSFVGACSRSLSSSVAKHAAKVSETALEQGWFERQPR